jgi:hypothetical protein
VKASPGISAVSPLANARDALSAARSDARKRDREPSPRRSSTLKGVRKALETEPEDDGEIVLLAFANKRTEQELKQTLVKVSLFWKNTCGC